MLILLEIIFSPLTHILHRKYQIILNGREKKSEYVIVSNSLCLFPLMPNMEQQLNSSWIVRDLVGVI